MKNYRLYFKNTNKKSLDLYDLEKAIILQNTIKRLFDMEVEIIEEKNA